MKLSAAFFFSALLLTGAPAMAQIYSCTVNGKTDFQDRPCPSASVSQAVVAADGGEFLVGCYDTDLSTKRVQMVNRVRIKKIPGKGYELSNPNQSSRNNLMMKPASVPEMKALSQSIFVEVTHGLRVQGDSKPHGFYRGLDKQGKEVFYFYWREDHANPFAKKVAC